MDLEVHALTENQAIEFVMEELAAGRGGVTITPNLDHLRRYMRELGFRSLVAEADLVVPDGMPLIWASRLKGTPLPARVAGSDLILSLSKSAATQGRSVYLLGGDAGTAEGAADILRQRNPDIQIAGFYCPPFGFEKNPAEMAKIIQQLEAARPDIVYVALGSPKQEMLIDRIKSHLPSAWWIGVGVSFSFLTGAVTRAPRWMQKTGIEWAHRMFQEPGKLLRRYLIEGIPFGCILMMYSLWHRVMKLSGFHTGPVRAARRPDPTSAPASSPLQATAPNDALPDLSSDNTGSDPLTDALIGNAVVGEFALGFVPGGANFRVSSELAAANVLQSSDLSGASDFTTPFVRPIKLIQGESPVAALPRLKSMVLLGGQVRASAFAAAIGRPVLDLPVNEANESLINHWLRAIGDLASFAGIEQIQVQLLLSNGQARPVSQVAPANVGFAIKDDTAAYRGTGGVLRDLCKNYEDNDWILVANAAQLLMEPLSVLAAALAHKRADVTLINHIDGTPSGLMLIRCAALRVIKPIGYVDMKEQALPQISKQFDVKVVHCRRPTGCSIRSSTDYIAAVRQLARGGRRDRRHAIDPLAEDFARSFAIIEPGAAVDPDAYLHDAVVLRGARVESSAAVVRSILAADAIVTRSTRVVDQLVSEHTPWTSSRPAFSKVASDAKTAGSGYRGSDYRGSGGMVA